MSLGIEPYQPPIKPILIAIEKNSPAAKIGFKVGDTILKVNDQKITSAQQLNNLLQPKPNTEFSFTIKRNYKNLILRGKTGTKSGTGWQKIGYLGVKFLPAVWPKELLNKQQYSLPTAFFFAVNHTYNLLHFNAIVLWKLIIGKISLNMLGGPITIFSAAQQAFHRGTFIYFEFLGLLSVMLAFINILPIPTLDGGNFLFLVAEAIIRKPIPEKTQAIAMRVGLIILALIIFIAMSNDILRLMR